MQVELQNGDTIIGLQVKEMSFPTCFRVHHLKTSMNTFSQLMQHENRPTLKISLGLTKASVQFSLQACHTRSTVAAAHYCKNHPRSIQSRQEANPPSEIQKMYKPKSARTIQDMYCNSSWAQLGHSRYQANSFGGNSNSEDFTPRD